MNGVRPRGALRAFPGPLQSPVAACVSGDRPSWPDSTLWDACCGPLGFAGYARRASSTSVSGSSTAAREGPELTAVVHACESIRARYGDAGLATAILWPRGRGAHTERSMTPLQVAAQRDDTARGDIVCALLSCIPLAVDAASREPHDGAAAAADSAAAERAGAGAAPPRRREHAWAGPDSAASQPHDPYGVPFDINAEGNRSLLALDQAVIKGTRGCAAVKALLARGATHHLSLPAALVDDGGDSSEAEGAALPLPADLCAYPLSGSRAAQPYAVTEEVVRAVMGHFGVGGLPRQPYTRADAPLAFPGGYPRALALRLQLHATLDRAPPQVDAVREVLMQVAESAAGCGASGLAEAGAGAGAGSGGDGAAAGDARAGAALAAAVLWRNPLEGNATAIHIAACRDTSPGARVLCLLLSLVPTGERVPNDHDGWTPLHFAAYNLSTDADATGVRALVARGVDAVAVTSKGKSAVDVAEMGRNEVCARVLRAHTDGIAVVGPQAVPAAEYGAAGDLLAVVPGGQPDRGAATPASAADVQGNGGDNPHAHTVHGVPAPRHAPSAPPRPSSPRAAAEAPPHALAGAPAAGPGCTVVGAAAELPLPSAPPMPDDGHHSGSVIAAVPRVPFGSADETKEAAYDVAGRRGSAAATAHAAAVSEGRPDPADLPLPPTTVPNLAPTASEVVAAPDRVAPRLSLLAAFAPSEPMAASSGRSIGGVTVTAAAPRSASELKQQQRQRQRSHDKLHDTRRSQASVSSASVALDNTPRSASATSVCEGGISPAGPNHERRFSRLQVADSRGSGVERGAAAVTHGGADDEYAGRFGL